MTYLPLKWEGAICKKKWLKIEMGCDNLEITHGTFRARVLLTLVRYIFLALYIVSKRTVLTSKLWRSYPLVTHWRVFAIHDIFLAIVKMLAKGLVVRLGPCFTLVTTEPWSYWKHTNIFGQTDFEIVFFSICYFMI